MVYLRHWGLLVGALHIVSSDAISIAELDTAEKLLLEFYNKFPELYSMSIQDNRILFIYIIYAQWLGEERCSMNVHILSHLVECVKNWGPISCYSCFAFETRNSDIKRLFHGSKDMSKQVFNYSVHCSRSLHAFPPTDGLFLYLDASYPKGVY